MQGYRTYLSLDILLRQDTAHPKVSFKKRRKMAGWDGDECIRVLGIRPL